MDKPMGILQWLKAASELLTEVLGAEQRLTARMDKLEEKTMASFDDLGVAIDALAQKVASETAQVVQALESLRSELSADASLKLDAAIEQINAIGASVSDIVPDQQV